MKSSMSIQDLINDYRQTISNLEIRLSKCRAGSQNYNRIDAQLSLLLVVINDLSNLNYDSLE